MRLGLRIFFGFFVIAGLAGALLFKVFLAEVKPSVREVMEDLMVESAHLVAVLAQDEVAALQPGQTLSGGRLELRLREFAARPVDLRIWGLRKQKLDLRIYLTDTEGHVLLDSAGLAQPGESYADWRDVALTLRGEYGARTTRSRAGDDRSTVMFVAAPVRDGDRLIGVVTVAKPQASVQQFIDRAERSIRWAGLALLALSLLVGLVVTLWLVASVRRLRRFAQGAQAGQRDPPPALPGELGELALAMDDMRARLEGREHVQQTVRALTHELKSPLAALRASAELLEDELSPADRQHFARQVVQQSQRLQSLVERMLELSKLEAQAQPGRRERLDLSPWLTAAVGLACERLDLRPDWRHTESLTVEADPALLELALSNLLGNAADFAGADRRIELSLGRDGDHAGLSLRDFGPGVPPALLAHLGERFVSTARPGSAVKGSGLGLAMVRQIALLHGGALAFEAAEPGLRVRLSLPLA